MSEFKDNIFEHMELQKRLMKSCGVFELSEDEKLEVTLLNIAGESLEAMGFVLDKTKPWKNSEIDYDDLKEEVIDVYHFFLQLLVITDTYSRVINFSYGYIELMFNKLESMKTALKRSAQEAADLSVWRNKDMINRFVIDQFDRFLTVFFALDMTPEDVDRIYRAKNEKNFQRIKEKLSGSN